MSGESRYLACAGREIHCTLWGAENAPVVVAWHGLARTGRDMDAVAARLTARYRALTRKGKLKTVAVTAVARELSAFIWAINRQVANPGAAAR